MTLNLAEDILGEQLLDVDRRLDLASRPLGGMILSEPPGLISTYFSPISPLVLIDAIESSWSFMSGSIRTITRAW